MTVAYFNGLVIFILNCFYSFMGNPLPPILVIIIRFLPSFNWNGKYCYELLKKYLFLAKKGFFFNNPYQLIFPIPVKGRHKTNEYYGNENGGVIQI